jgi:phosphatidate cytidylyltransferase
MEDIHSLHESINKKAGRNLGSSILVSAAIITLVFGSLAINPAIFAVLVTVALMIAIRELNHAYRIGGVIIPDWMLVIAVPLTIAAAWFGKVSLLAIALAFVTTNVMVLLMFLDPVDFVKRSTAAVFAIFYIPFLGGFLVLLAHHDDAVARILTLVVLTSCNDTFAYIFGVLFGKHYLAPHISPKKTWEGLIGSVIATTVGASLVFHYSLHRHWWLGTMIGLMAVATATCGDLIESAMKRDLHIKDMSNFLPGHGGILDRLDSILFTAPAVWAVLELVNHYKL